MRKVALTMLLALAAACGTPARPASGPTEPPAATSPSPAETVEVTLYYLIEGKNRLYLAPERHPVAKTPAIARAALEELVHGAP